MAPDYIVITVLSNSNIMRTAYDSCLISEMRMKMTKLFNFLSGLAVATIVAFSSLSFIVFPSDIKSLDNCQSEH